MNILVTQSTLNYGEFFFNLNSETHSSTATYAYISDGILQNTGIALFDKDKFLTNLTVMDSIAYSLITNNINTCIISVKDPFVEGELLDVSIHPREDSKIDVSLVNGYPYIEIDIKLRYTLESASSSFDYESTDTLQTLENHINSYIEKICLSFLYKISHEYNKDICNFQNSLSSKYLTYDEFEKINWNEIYKESFFKVIIDGSIQDSGLFIKE